VNGQKGFVEENNKKSGTSTFTEPLYEMVGLLIENIIL